MAYAASPAITKCLMNHAYTRTAALLDQFAGAFSAADDVIVNKIYGSVREDGAGDNWKVGEMVKKAK